jgi:glutathione reductase (NADPH)
LLKLAEVKKESNGLTLTTKNNENIEDVDCLLFAIGRKPSTDTLNLDKIGEDEILI